MQKVLNLLILSIFLVFVAGTNLSAQVPSIVSVSPSDNELAVGTSSNITVTFDIDMDGSSFSSTTFIVFGAYTGNYAGAYSYDSPSKTVTFDPNTDFVTGEVVSILLTTAVQSSALTPLAGSYAWSFTCDVSLSTGIFGGALTYTVGSQPHGLAAGDFDNDGKIDIASALFGSNEVSVVINDGVGGFNPASSYLADAGPRSVVAADVNRDGFLDLISANGSTNTISVFINNGDGTFATQAVYTTGSRPHYVTAGDYDGDGYVDIATANFGSGNASVLINIGDGTFPSHTEYAVGSGPAGIFTADLDGDNDLDLVTANRTSDDIGVLFNNGNGTFSSVVNYIAGNGPRSVFAADLDGDGDLDLATANEYSSDMTVLFNDGTGIFTISSFYSAGTNSYSVIAGDFDGDDDLDLAVANVNSDDVYVYYNLGAGTFSSPVVHPTGNGSLPLVAADLDGAGVLDLITGDFFSSNISVLNNADGAVSIIFPETLFAAQAYAIVPATLTITLGNFVDGHTAADINHSTILINGRVKAFNVTYLPTHENFSGDAVELEVIIPRFLASYQPIWGTVLQEYTVAGQFTDETSFSVTGRVTIIGHRAGDINRDGAVNISDLTYLIDFIFRGGPQPPVMELADVNGSCGQANIVDLTYFIGFIFRGGPSPLQGCSMP